MYPDHPQGRRITRRWCKPSRRHNRGGRSWVTTQHDPRQRFSQRAPIAHNGSRPAGGAAQVQREPVHLPTKQIAPAAGRLRHGFRAAYHHKKQAPQTIPASVDHPSTPPGIRPTAAHNGSSAPRASCTTARRHNPKTGGNTMIPNDSKDYYPTPPALAAELLAGLKIDGHGIEYAGGPILEPSAGSGDLAAPSKKPPGAVTSATSAPATTAPTPTTTSSCACSLTASSSPPTCAPC